MAIYNIPIIATQLTDTAGQQLPRGELVVTATDQNDNNISYQPSGSGQAVTGSTGYLVTAGVVTPFTLPDPAHTNPLNIRYRFTVIGSGGRSVDYPGVVITPNAPDGITFDFGLWVPGSLTSLPLQGLVVGPTGPAGPAGAAGLPLMNYIASATISAYTCVAVVNGQVITALSSAITHLGGVIGIASNSAVTGGNVAVEYTGPIVYNGWNWPTNATVFLSTNGTLTQTVPTSPTSAFSQAMGTPISPTTVLVQIQPPIALA